MTDQSGQYTAAMSQFVASGADRELPDEVIERVKLLTLDAMGCGLLGADLPWTQRLRDVVSATEGSGPAQVWGSGEHLSVANAALVNGTAVHGFELDDVGPGGHFGSVTITVGLASAQASGPVCGLDLIRATVSALEVTARISACVGGVPQTVCGFHGPGLFGTFAAAMTRAHLMGLGATEVSHALGHAAQFTGGLMGTHHGGMSKRLLAGKAAHSGVVAANLAGGGFTNVTNIFECGFGSFPSTFSGGRDTFKLEKLVEGLGTEFETLNLTFKPWACRMPIHPFLDTIRAFQREEGLRPEDVVEVRLGVAEGTIRAVGFPYTPSSVATAQLNLQYCVAILLLEGEVFADQFSEDKLADPAVLDMVSRIKIHHEPELDGRAPRVSHSGTMVDGAIVEVLRADGSQLAARTSMRPIPSGEAARTEIADKFRRLSSKRLSTNQQEELIELCWRLDEIDDVAELLRLL